MTQYAEVRNTQTGQRAVFPLPFLIGDLEKIGVSENFEGLLFVDGDDDTFGYGSDGYLTVEELRAYLQDYKNRQNPYHFDYMMLSRLQSDCDYFLGYGRFDENRLWAGSVPDQIAEMKKIWKKFPKDEKPEWLSWAYILRYERKMSDDVYQRILELYRVQNQFDWWMLKGISNHSLEEWDVLFSKMKKLYHTIPEDRMPEFSFSRYQRFMITLKEGERK